MEYRIRSWPYELTYRLFKGEVQDVSFTSKSVNPLGQIVTTTKSLEDDPKFPFALGGRPCKHNLKQRFLEEIRVVAIKGMETS